MNKFAALLGLVFACTAASAAEPNMHVLQGTVTDFSGHPIAGATVEVRDKKFDALYSTKSDEGGHYSLKVADGLYESITCIRMKDYASKSLEFWAWHIPVHADMTLDMRYDRLEVYGVNVFRIQGAYPGTVIYFRPMSLTRYPDFVKSGGDLAPSKDELEVTIDVNGKQAKINSVQPIVEYAGEKSVTGYIVQIAKSKAEKPDVDVIHIVAKDKKTGDMGEGYYFWTKPQYR